MAQTQTRAGFAVPRKYLVTVVDCYWLEADDEDDALDQLVEIRPNTKPDSTETYVEVAND